jgi:serine/threonine protein kinase
MMGSLDVVMTTDDVVDGRYRIIRVLGQGGMGTVFLAEHTLIHRRVAIKILHQELAADADVVKRFMNEARAAGILGHPNIVESTDMGFADDRVPYIVFEYLEGTLLTDEIYRVGGLPVRRAVRIAQQITSALHAAHSARIVHRDLKSDNIFLAHRDDTLDHVKVLDFGISRFLSADNEQTRRNIVMGTPEFMAPEQITAPDRVDLRADIYALGVILYEMLAARRPFSNDEDPRTLLHRIVYNDPPPLDRPEVPRALDDLVMKLLAKSPDDRYPSMSDVGVVLNSLTTQGNTQQPRTTRPFYAITSDQRHNSPSPPSDHSPASTEETPWPVSHEIARAASLLPPNKRRWPPIAIAGGGLAVGLLGLAFALHSGGPADSAAPAPIHTEPIKRPSPPLAAPDRVPDKVPISLDADVPNARVTFRRRVLAAPTTTKVMPNDVVELVEVSAPGYRTVRYWLTFDRPTQLVARLAKGSGSVEATEEETLIALGEISAPTAADAPSNATARAAVTARTAPGRSEGTHVAMPANRPAGVQRSITPHAAANDGAQQRTTPRRIGLAQAEATIAPAENRSPAVEAVDPPPPEPPPAQPPPAQPPPAQPPQVEPPKVEPPRPVAAEPEPEPEPTIDPAVVTTVIGRYRPEVLKCVAPAKRKNPKLRGTLTLQLQVDATGAVKHAQTLSTLSNPPVAACIAKAAQKWNFPARPAGQIAIVNYRFVIN